MSIIYSQSGKPRESAIYKWIQASVTQAGTTPTVDLITQTGFETLFTGLVGSTAYRITIEVSGTTYIRLNAVTNDIITVTSTAPYIDEWCNVKKIYIATNGAAVTVTVKLK